MSGVFNNPDVFVQSWYPALRSNELRSKPRTVELVGGKIVVFRDRAGVARALHARCPHLGADLGAGTVAGDEIRCGFHGWTFDGAGRCSTRSAVRAVAYPAQERYGAIWIFNGPEALFDVPSLDGHVWTLKPQHLRCHPHLVACNGLDLEHFQRVHDIRLLEPPTLDQPDPFRTVMRLRVRLDSESVVDRVLRAIGGDDVDVVFATIGGNMATLEGSVGRWPLRVLFTHSPEGGGSLSRTFLFAPRRWMFPLSLAIVVRIVAADRQILDGIEFRPNLTPEDWPLAAFIRQVDAMRTFQGASGERKAFHRGF